MIVSTKFASLRSGKLPEGCKLCVEGKKLVLFITGLCSRRCWYCSLSKRRFLVDKTWANERLCKSEKDALKEARAMEAQGAGITGGDPLLVLNRTLKYARALKKAFKIFHIHIYLPTDRVTTRALSALSKYVDEVRFHPSFLLNGKSKEDIKKIRLASLFFNKSQIGCEIPAIPGKENKTRQFVSAVKDYIGFLNINELEWSDTNAAALSRRFGRKIGYIVRGSSTSAKKILQFCDRIGLRAHFCSAATKSLYQYRNRLARLAKNVKKSYDMLADSYILLRAALYLPESRPGLGKQLPKATILKKLRKKFFEARKIVRKAWLDKERLRILTSASAALKHKEELRQLGLVPALVEELPTADVALIRLDWL